MEGCGRKDGRMDGRMDRSMDGRMDGSTKGCGLIIISSDFSVQTSHLCDFFSSLPYGIKRFF